MTDEIELAATADEVAVAGEQVSLDILVDWLGPDAAEAFFERVDGTRREGNVIHATNVRGSRSQGVVTKARTHGHAQLVVPGRAGRGRRHAVDLGGSVVVINMDDFQAVVRAGQVVFDWRTAFAPRSGLPAAETRASIVPGSRGRRQLRG